MTRSLRIRALVLVGLCLLVAQCDSPASPDPLTSVNVTGTWTGTVEDSFSGSGTVQVTLVQNGSSVTGTWSIVFPSGTIGGNVSGGVTAFILGATLEPSESTVCPIQVTAEVSGNTMRGTYASFDCTVDITGEVTLMRS